MRPLVQYIRQHLRPRIHPYMDDFMVATSTHGKLSEDSSRVADLLRSCGLKRNLEKGCWEGSRRIEHLGFIIDTEGMLFGITENWITKLAGIARLLLSKARHNRSMVEVSLLRHFNGVEISCYLAMSLDRFHTRELYNYLKTSTQSVKRTRITHEAIKEL